VKSLAIPLLSGDGIGPELAAAARAIIDALNQAGETNIDLVEFPAGYSAYRSEGNALPERTLDAMRRAPASILAAVSVTECPPPSVMGQIRQRIGLFADIRHCVSRPGSCRAGVDLVMFRECSEGFLSDRNMFRGAGEFMPTPDVALSVRLVTREKCEQIANLAFAYARKQKRKKITVAHKEVVFSMGCGLFLECVRKQHALFPDIALEEELVDDLAGHLVGKPESYDMVLTTNMFGDILADVAAAQVGGMVPVINASASTSFFCPVHAAHNDIAGKQMVNPLVMMRTISAMLEWLDMGSAARSLKRAIEQNERPEISTSLRLPRGCLTSEVTQAVAQAVRSNGRQNT
jgi:3-isopropylmalate dehydrogenase